jgi:AcrR family transcriptional regulator
MSAGSCCLSPIPGISMNIAYCKNWGQRQCSAKAAPEASLEAVARHAGVGIGTLSRHFPTHRGLYEAVYRREVEQLVELAKHLETNIAPVEALRRWLRAGVEFMATKKGMASSWTADMPFECVAMRCAAQNHTVSGNFDRCIPGRYRRLATAVEAFVGVSPAPQQRCASVATGRTNKPLWPTPLEQERRTARLV